MTPDAALRPAVFLDRDGVLNYARVVAGRPYPPKDASDVRILPGAAEACVTLSDAGLLLIVITNQPDVARGTTTRAVVEAVNREVLRRVRIDEVVVCFHDTADGCACRKPEHGMLSDTAHRRHVDLSLSVVVGDRWSDMEAGRRAGCRTVFLDYGYTEPAPTSQDLTVRSLMDAVPWILGACRISESS